MQLPTRPLPPNLPVQPLAVDYRTLTASRAGLSAIAGNAAIGVGIVEMLLHSLLVPVLLVGFIVGSMLSDSNAGSHDAHVLLLLLSLPLAYAVVLIVGGATRRRLLLGLWLVLDVPTSVAASIRAVSIFGHGFWVARVTVLWAIAAAMFAGFVLWELARFYRLGLSKAHNPLMQRTATASSGDVE